MSLKHAQLSIRTGMIAVLVLAVWLGLMRAILSSSSVSFDTAAPAGLFTMIYVWAIILVLVIRAEGSPHSQGLPPEVWARRRDRRFVVWLWCWLITPLLMLLVALISPAPSIRGGLSPLSHFRDFLFWLPLIHWLTGMIICRDMRWPAFLMGVPIFCSTFLMRVCFALVVVFDPSITRS